MHKFVDYISDLLFLHDCVIVPDVGAFICNYKSAYIDENTGMIYPPSKEIAFNKNLKNNDGLLVNWICAKENISYSQALKQLQLFSEDLKVRLNQGKRIPFGDIGVFYTDRRFNVVFETGSYNFLADSYGMDKIEVPKVEQTIDKHTSKNDDATNPKQSSAPQIKIPPYNDMTPYINMDGSNLVHKLMKYGVAAVVLAGLVMLVLFVGQRFSSDEDNFEAFVGAASVPIGKTIENHETVVSPDYDYVSYEPEITL
ncbi:MAG: hypothetical protein LBM07_07770 [Culturomica sp.]|jgi:hypothetical protein|nr:hypothetical protein [Culturomica sp.]